MATVARRPGPEIVGGLALGPAASVGLAVFAAWLAQLAPDPTGGSIGFHTLVPAVTVLPVAGVVVGALALGLAAAAWLGLRPRASGLRWPRLVVAAGAGELAFFLAQLILVDRLQGIPDALPLVLALVALHVLVGVGFPVLALAAPADARAGTAPWTRVGPAQPFAVQVAIPGSARVAPRPSRGPPGLLTQVD